MREDEKETAGAIDSGVTRREFIGTSLAAGAAVALGAALPSATAGGGAQAPAVRETLRPIASIGTPGQSPIQGVIKLLNENKTYLAGSAAGSSPVSQSGQMRYLSGSVGGKEIWPTTKGIPQPGPTIRAKVGDTVQITLMNQVDVAAFGDSLDRGETTGSCDVATSAGPGGSVNTYPGNPPFDTMPNCYHGSSTANLHYHGSHISPNVLGDNVLVQLRPSPRANGRPVVDERYLEKNDFDDIFKSCDAHPPQVWNDLPKKWRDRQQQLLTDYDKTAVWQGKRGALPRDQQLWPKDDEDIRAGRWPQFYIGAYPSCFTLPKWNGQANSMGQAPGTHWYHAHKHGSTALNLSNGMAGAFIVEGDYDDKLRPYYNKEVVLVLGQYAAQVNLERAPGTAAPPLVYVNGQYTPYIEMAPNEVQLWRIVNTCHSAAVPINGPAGIQWIQTAQDGVQLHPDNYQRGLDLARSGGSWTNATLTSPMKARPWFGNLAPGNRVDMLVKAPASGGPFDVTFGGRNTLLLTVRLNGSVTDRKNFPPAKEMLAPMPPFLNDIVLPVGHVKRELHFASAPTAGTRGTPTANPAGTNPPRHTIDGKLFQDHHVDQTMQLGAIEEWTIYNDPVKDAQGKDQSGPAHPFHIHINPFQITEILNPSVSKNAFKLDGPWVWWDDVAIPPPAVPPDASQADKDAGNMTSGYVKFRSRFVDFTGMYVLHCHILGHEDRGMMQLVQVISNTTSMGHR